MSDAFRYYLRVRYGECDAQKVVFNARYGDYIDLASTEFMRSLGYEEALSDGSLDYQLVKQTIEWRAPAAFDQVLEVAVHTKAVGNTSFTLGFTFRIAGAPEVIAEAETIYVLVDAETLQKRPIPDALRADYLKGAPGKTVDHAAWGKA